MEEDKEKHGKEVNDDLSRIIEKDSLDNDDDNEEEEEEERELIPPSSPTSFGPTSELSSPLPFARSSSPSSRLFTDSFEEDDNEGQNLDQQKPHRGTTRRRLIEEEQEEDEDEPHSPPPVASVPNDSIPPLRSELPDDVQDKAVIWGTTVRVKEAKRCFREFLEQFPSPHNGQPLYPKLMEQMRELGTWILNVDCEFLWMHDANLYKQLLNYPTEIIHLMEETTRELCAQFWPNDFNLDTNAVHTPTSNELYTPSPPVIQIRPFNVREIKPMRDLDPEDIDKLVCIRGMIIRTSSIIPDLQSAFFSCSMCHHGEYIAVVDGVLNESKRCERCQTRGSMTIIHNRCVFTDKQWIKLQETPDAIPEGETPHTVSLYAYNELVDVERPGDRVSVTGIYRAVPVRYTSHLRTLRSLYKTYIDVLHYRKETNRLLLSKEGSRINGIAMMSLDSSDEETDIGGLEIQPNISDQQPNAQVMSTELERRLRQLSQEPDIYERLAHSIAPSIWQMDDVKKGVLLQLFGGTSKVFEQSGIGRFRGEINVLLCGDPGTSKSQLLQYVNKIAPRGIYTSGKGSSAVGLTAYIAKDPETRETVLESGALVLSDKGVCCIDEFDKMSDHTRSILHEVMEQQTVSIAKAGIICTLNARTSILASANPRESRYNPRLSVVENIQLPPTLLSRFDLIYLVLDKPEEQTDRKLATHLVSLYYREPERIDSSFIDMEILTEYISYAKRRIHPQLTDEASEMLIHGYVDMRKLGGNKKTITATPRQLESLVRLSEAHARMRFSESVEKTDVTEAIRLVKSALQQAAIDPRTGIIDMDLITTGRSAMSRSRLTDIANECRTLITQRIPSFGTWKFDQLYRTLTEQSSVEISLEELRDALKLLSDEELISLTLEKNPSIRRLS